MLAILGEILISFVSFGIVNYISFYFISHVLDLTTVLLLLIVIITLAHQGPGLFLWL